MERDTSSVNSAKTGPDSLGHVDDWAGLALDYVEGRLGTHERSLVERHLSSCPSCRERVEEQRWVAAWAASVRPAEPPADLESRVMSAVRLDSERPSWLADVVPAPVEDLVPAPPVARTADSTDSAIDRRARERREAARRAASPSWSERLRALFQPRNLAIAGALVAVVVVGTVTFRTQQAAVEDVAGARQATSTTAAAMTVAVTSGDQEQTPTSSEGPTGTTQPGASVQTTTTTGGGEPTTTQDPTLTSAGVTTTLTASTTAETGTTLTSEPAVSLATGAPEPLWVAFSRDDTTPEVAAAGFQEITGLTPLPRDHWMGGPTFAVVASVGDVATLLDHLRLHGFRAEASKQPVDVMGNAVNLILAGFTGYPVISLSSGAMRISHVNYTKLPPSDHALLVFFTSQ